MEFLRMAAVVLIMMAVIGDTAVTVSKVDAGLVCGMTYKGINACKPSISGSNPKPLTKQCCIDLATTDLPCLCTHKNSFLFRVLGIDSKLAMQLPPKCNLKLPAHCFGPCGLFWNNLKYFFLIY